ncbi:hypothetical protein [Streptomyces sp. NPDC001450]
MTSTELVHVPRPEPRRLNVRPYVAGTVRVVGDAVRQLAVLALLVTPAIAITPDHDWNLQPPPSWLGLVVVMLALLGVERIGLALHDLGDSIEHPTH